MKKIVFLLVSLILTATAVFAQDSFVYESDHYRIRSHISEAHAEETAERMESYLSLFNDYFHFDLNELDYKLKVQVFDAQNQFDSYLTRLIDETRNEFVYLHYSDVSRSELIGALEDGEEFDQSLTHQAFVQFIRAFVQNPPLWLREGFAVYFEEAVYDVSFGAAINKENLSWLETLKDILFGEQYAQGLSADQILAIDVETAKDRIEVFYPEAWGVVNYLVNTENRNHNRIIWDAISAMDPSAKLAENSKAVYNSAFQWINEEELQTGFLEYFMEKKTYKELIEAGIADYESENLDSSEENFLIAINRQDISFIPYYYLGLIYYNKGNYSLAEHNYNEALERGSEKALINYAMGLNAFVDNRFTEAREFLEVAMQLDPENYTQKVSELFERMES